MRILYVLLIWIFSFHVVGCTRLKDLDRQAKCQSQIVYPSGTIFDHNDLLPDMLHANIILILLDDMDYSSFAYMPYVQELLENEGTSFHNYLVNVSLCCPSRATTLLGMYAHNSGILTNNRRHGGFAIFKKLGHEEDNFVTRLEQAGYRTALFGKYLNGYPFNT